LVWCSAGSFWSSELTNGDTPTPVDQTHMPNGIASSSPLSVYRVNSNAQKVLTPILRVENGMELSYPLDVDRLFGDLDYAGLGAQVDVLALEVAFAV
jgi:hypothetical protein